MPATTSKSKIAIVDSDESLRNRISTALADDFEVVQGEDYPDAYTHLQESLLDVLLLGMPLTPGENVSKCTELLARLAAGNIDTLVIVLSSDERKNTALKVIDAGAYDYFIKPIDMDVLRALLFALHRKAACAARKPHPARRVEPQTATRRPDRLHRIDDAT